MICRNCGTPCSDTTKFCKACGAPLTPAQQVYQQPMYQQMPQQQFQPQQPVQVIVNAPEEDKEPVTTIGQYLGWSLMAAIPFIGFILTIVFAVMGEYKNRANFFRAILVWYLIVVVIGFVFGMLAVSGVFLLSPFGGVAY